MTNCKFVNISAKSDIPKDILWDGKLLFIVPKMITLLLFIFSNNMFRFSKNLFILKFILILMTLKVSDIGEKELVRYIISNSKDITPDDTAITDFDNTNLISTCDMLIQSRHFPQNMSYFDMGFKAVTVNVSDLAAMGAEPLGFLLAIASPKGL